MTDPQSLWTEIRHSFAKLSPVQLSTHKKDVFKKCTYSLKLSVTATLYFKSSSPFSGSNLRQKTLWDTLRCLASSCQLHCLFKSKWCFMVIKNIHPSIHLQSLLILHSRSKGVWSLSRLSQGQGRLRPGQVASWAYSRCSSSPQSPYTNTTVTFQ